jgi:hypothetical protein
VSKYTNFKRTPAFRKAFIRLGPAEQRAAVAAFKIFKNNPFDPQLRTHMIKKLSARWRRTIYAVDILGDLRAVFYTDGETVYSVDIGTHDIYK